MGRQRERGGGNKRWEEGRVVEKVGREGGRGRTQ